MKNSRFPKFKVTANFLFFTFLFLQPFLFSSFKGFKFMYEKKKYILYAKRGNFAVEQMMSGNDFFFLKLISYRKVNFQNISLFR